MEMFVHPGAPVEGKNLESPPGAELSTVLARLRWRFGSVALPSGRFGRRAEDLLGVVSLNYAIHCLA